MYQLFPLFEHGIGQNIQNIQIHFSFAFRWFLFHWLALCRRSLMRMVYGHLVCRMDYRRLSMVLSLVGMDVFILLHVYKAQSGTDLMLILSTTWGFLCLFFRGSTVIFQTALNVSKAWPAFPVLVLCVWGLTCLSSSGFDVLVCSEDDVYNIFPVRNISTSPMSFSFSVMVFRYLRRYFISWMRSPLNSLQNFTAQKNKWRLRKEQNLTYLYAKIQRKRRGVFISEHFLWAMLQTLIKKKKRRQKTWLSAFDFLSYINSILYRLLLYYCTI